jgi:hypothetical protein
MSERSHVHVSFPQPAITKRIGEPMVRDVITQGELEAVLAIASAADHLLWSFRRRLDAGAAIEAGELGLEVDFRVPLEPWYDTRNFDTGGWGISIGQSQDVATVAAIASGVTSVA